MPLKSVGAKKKINCRKLKITEFVTTENKIKIHLKSETESILHGYCTTEKFININITEIDQHLFAPYFAVCAR